MVKLIIPILIISLGFLSDAYIFHRYINFTSMWRWIWWIPFTVIVGFFIKPVGPYTPFLTISCALSGIIYGMFLFNKEASWKNVIISQLIVTIFINLLLDTYWLTILFGNGFMALLPMRALKSVIFFPVQVVLIYAMAKYAPVFKKKFNY